MVSLLKVSAWLASAVFATGSLFAAGVSVARPGDRELRGRFSDT